jgi:hypothetical protein
MLRGSDFSLTVDGAEVAHEAFFCDVSRTSRLGLMAPDGIDGAGAVTLIMAYVTAFYDDYRRAGGEFYAYPDFYAFQRRTALGSYSMFDIWPEHKWVEVPPEPLATLRTITDRGVNILLVPDGEPVENAYDDVALASARRCINTCYAYRFDGAPSDADVTVTSAAEPLADWVRSLFASLSESDAVVAARAERWLAAQAGGALTQAFRRIPLDAALALL